MIVLVDIQIRDKPADKNFYITYKHLHSLNQTYREKA